MLHIRRNNVRLQLLGEGRSVTTEAFYIHCAGKSTLASPSLSVLGGVTLDLSALRCKQIA
jgi:hypothetical protein